MHRRTFIKQSGTAGLVTLITPRGVLDALTGQEASSLEERFRQPLPSDRPQVLWFWMNGHVSKEGITLDLEAMKEAGIGGVFHFDAGVSIPKGPVEWGSPEWKALKQHALEEAARLGLEYTAHNCPGWSSSGGPWITPELAMQQLTWSELYTATGGLIDRQLPLPFHKLDYYRDIAILAYPSLEGERQAHQFNATSSSGPVSAKAVTGEDPEGVTVRPAAEGEPAWLQLEYPAPYRVRSLTFLVSAAEQARKEKRGLRTSVVLESSDDGRRYNTIATIPTGVEAALMEGDKFITYDIEPTTARYFRLSSSEPRRYRQLRFSGITRLPQFMEKTGNRFMFSGKDTSPLYSSETEVPPLGDVIRWNSVLDISGYMDKSGHLRWSAPPGPWTILRFGYTPIGSTNKAAPGGGTGLECDKFSRRTIDFHFARMLPHLLPFATPKGLKGKLGLEIDSYEAGPQTWTRDFSAEFSKSRNYSIIPYLPALTGRILNDRDTTERFLWDYRRVQADLIAENYYGRFTELCHRHGFTSYIQPYDKGPFEEMQIGSKVDVSLGESWYGLSSILQGNRSIRRTTKLAASMAHTAGRKQVGAEAFTSEPESSRWQEYPFALKALGDKIFTQGVNRMVIHRFAHQPHPTAAPGMTMGPWGIHFDRTNTWFPQSKGWLRYLARCQALLQQGLPVADLAYFTGEEANVYTHIARDELNPTPPEGYDYDGIHADTLLHKVQVRDGRLFLPDGTNYRALVLQDYKALTPALLQKLRELVEAGMVLIGQQPERSLGLHTQTEEALFQKTATDLWGSIDSEGITQRSFGRGQVIWDTPIADVLRELNTPPDFTYTSRSGDAPILYLHRKTPEADIYFVSNQRRSHEEVVASFRVKSKQPELWDAITGSIIPAPLYELEEDRVRLPLQLEPYGSVFVVFRKKAPGSRLLAVKKEDQWLLDTKPFATSSRTLFPDVYNNFTIALWAKPEMNIMTRPSIHMGEVKHPYTDYYAIYPLPGKKLYGAGHATCGLAIGRNGVAVWEHEDYPVLTLVAETPLSGWSHVSLVYEEGTPSVYVNGALVTRGVKSSRIIHPGLGEAYLGEGASYYNGDRSEPLLIREVVNPERLGQLIKEGPPAPYPPPPVQIISHHHKPALLITQKGHYSLQMHPKGISHFTIDDIEQPLYLNEEWALTFPPGSGAPESFSLPRLVSLHRVEAEGIKYFSGTARYSKQFTLPRRPSGDQRLLLNLGRVEVIAQVRVNGKDLGVLWKRPYRADISESVKPGVNTLEIEVTNLWPNRLIGDEQLPEAYRFTMAGASGFEQLVGGGFESLIGSPIAEVPEWYVKGAPQPPGNRAAFTTWKHFSKEDPLLESGLVGPVALQWAVIRAV